MSLTIDQVIAKVDQQEDPTIGIVQDGNIYYFVLNNKNDWLFNTNSLNAMEKTLDELEQSLVEGEPGVLVTVSAGKRKWSTGFDLKFWEESWLINQASSFSQLQGVLRRIITFPLPTLAVISGHCFAGGLFMALCHDRRIMINNPQFKVCLSELNIGMPFMQVVVVLLRDTLTPQANRVMQLGVPFTPEQALGQRAIHGLYKDNGDAEVQVQLFEKQFSR